MKAIRVDEFHKHGCYFFGKLVVVDYTEDMESDPKWGTFGGGVSLDYLGKARNLIAERQYKVVRELLSLPVLVVEIE